jgi:CheY-like chemotaxis protein
MSGSLVVCDDDAHILRAIVMKLEKAGHRLATAPNGARAWELVRERRPDLVVSDCQMPEMDGLELCRRISADETLRGLPVILLTAKGYELDEDQLRRELGVRRLMAKPFSPRELLQTVEELLAERAAVPAGPTETA